MPISSRVSGAPQEQAPLVTWWADPADFYVTARAQWARWATSKLAEMTVPKASVPMLGCRCSKRGVLLMEQD